MTPAEIIHEIYRYGGRIEASGDRLNLRAPEPLPGELMERIRQHKPEILRELTGAEIAEQLAERAAIQEFDGGLPRQRAEQAAIERLRVYEYRLTDSVDWLVLIAPGCSLEQAREACIVRFGSRLADIRPHRGKEMGK